MAQIKISTNLSFDYFEFKKWCMYFYNIENIFLNMCKKKYIFHVIVSYRWGEINTWDMWLTYNVFKKQSSKYNQNLTKIDIDELWKFLSNVHWLPLVTKVCGWFNEIPKKMMDELWL